MHADIPATSLLVGRDRELGVLRQHRDAALAGQGSLVLIGGEAGIGKTTLAETICYQAAEHGALILVGRCFDRTETPAYGPWLYLFERYQPAHPLPAHPAAFAEPGVVGAVPSQAALFRQVWDFLSTVTASRPAILLLDDLQWADPASLDLVRHIAQSVATLPLLILVTYRSDELAR
ncbi:MAG TPA: ATP-binding protein, partial [Thermomicrobiales bacterium]